MDKSYKDSISMVPVSINGELIELPVTYSSVAAENYRKTFEETKDFKRSFCTMLMSIITSNWGLIYEEADLNIELQDIMNASYEDLNKVYHTIINSSEYLIKFDKELDPQIADFYERFFNLNKREHETYVKPAVNNLVKSMSGISDIMGKSTSSFYKVMSPRISQFQNIQNVQNILNSIGPKWNLVPGFKMSAINYSVPSINFEHSESFLKVISAMTRNFDSLGKQIRSTFAGINFVNPELSKIAASLNSIKDIYNPNIIKSVQNEMALNAKIKDFMNPYQKVFEDSLRSLTRFEFNNKIIAFSGLEKSLIRNIDPFIFDIGTLLYENLNLERYLNEIAKILHKHGWWYISALPKDLLEKIHEDQDKLSKEEVNNMICECLEKNNFENLDAMVNDWFSLDIFDERKKIIITAIKAHKQRDYILVVPVLTPMIEGIIKDFMLKRYGIFDSNFKTLKTQFFKKYEQIESFIANYSIACINSLYTTFDWNNPGKTSDLNRHKLAHGYNIDCDNKVDSLRVILYLNEIFEMISGIIEVEAA